MRHRKSDHIKRLMTLTTKLRALILSLNEKNSLIDFLILFFSEQQGRRRNIQTGISAIGMKVRKIQIFFRFLMNFNSK